EGEQAAVDDGGALEDDNDTEDEGVLTDGGQADEDEQRGIWRPSPGTSWQIQLDGTIETSFVVEMYDIDLFDVPQSVIDELHRDGRVVICYFSAGSWEEWRPDADRFPQEAIGNRLDNWPGERWLDIRNQAVRQIMVERMRLAVSKRCDGVDPDNVDGYSNDTGFALTFADQLDYNRFLAGQAHALGLAVGLKNDVDQIEQLVDDFDWQLNEECFQYDECDRLLPFIQAGKAVFQIEYGGQSLADRICPRANAMNFDTLIKRIDLDAWRISCR
ncbi:MAG: endo alpha-1,4 polygalactosaminidase, partial [Deltaproteobacteria bacterium]